MTYTFIFLNRYVLHQFYPDRDSGNIVFVFLEHSSEARVPSV